MYNQLSIYDAPTTSIQSKTVVIDLTKYMRDKSHLTAAPSTPGCVPACTLKKDGTPKMHYSPDSKGGTQAAWPVMSLQKLREMAEWIYRNKDPKYLLAFVLGVNLGLRANELLGLRKHDLFTDDGRIRYNDDVTDPSDAIRVYQSKVKHSRNVYLNRNCVDILEKCFPTKESRYYTQADVEDDRTKILISKCAPVGSKDEDYGRGGKDFVFPSRQGEDRLHIRMWQRVLKEAAAACDVPWNIASHSMRKTFAWWAGHVKTVGCPEIDTAKVQRLLGHKDITTTMRYTNHEQVVDKADYHSVADILDIASHISL